MNEAKSQAMSVWKGPRYVNPPMRAEMFGHRWAPHIKMPVIISSGSRTFKIAKYVTCCSGLSFFSGVFSKGCSALLNIPLT